MTWQREGWLTGSTRIHYHSYAFVFRDNICPYVLLTGWYPPFIWSLFCSDFCDVVERLRYLETVRLQQDTPLKLCATTDRRQTPSCYLTHTHTHRGWRLLKLRGRGEKHWRTKERWPRVKGHGCPCPADHLNCTELHQSAPRARKQLNRHERKHEKIRGNEKGFTTSVTSLVCFPAFSLFQLTIKGNIS